MVLIFFSPIFFSEQNLDADHVRAKIRHLERYAEA